MAEDDAGLLHVYADLYRVSGNPQFAQTLRSALRWLRGVLRNPDSALFGGSQDADEEYFSLALESRQKRAAPYVDRILRGANPGELPVQAPTEYELVINLKTAKALGLDVPLFLQQRADEVIE